MKFFCFLSMLCFFAGSVVADQLKVSAGLPPVAYIANRIGGAMITVSSVLPEGRSPHDYSPGPQDIRNVAMARIFFTTTMSFEKSVIKPLKNVKIVDVTVGIKRIPFGDHHECNEDHEDHEHHNHHHDHDAMDPHVWLSIDNILIIAKNICRELSQLEPAKKQIFEKNLQEFQVQMLSLKQEILVSLSPYKNRKFYVYHPAFGYYAAMTGLKQEAVEINGREATGKHLTQLIRSAREEKVKTIFVQPQFNPAVASAIARAINGQVAHLDPLAGDLPENLQKITAAIQKGFSGK